MLSRLRRSEHGAAGRAGSKSRPSPVSTPGASLKAAPQPYAAEGGGSFAAPTGRALSSEIPLDAVLDGVDFLMLGFPSKKTGRNLTD